MIRELLVGAGAAIVGALGLGHLLLTYRGPKLLPRDPSVRHAMAGTPLVITSQTDVWRAWIGFNASHAIGAMLFGAVYGYLALARPDVLFGSSFLQAVAAVVLGGYVWLAQRYWFVTPLIGTTVALLCFLTAIGIGWLS